MSGDLFHQTPGDWTRDPIAAFDNWLSEEGYKASSAEVYRALWHRFLEWLNERQIPLERVDNATMENFLETRKVRREQRARYLRLIERAFDQIRRAQLGTANPARGAALVIDAEWKKTKANDPTSFLTVVERTSMIMALAQPLESELSGTNLWREARDRALTAMFLGCGLKLAEATTLPLRTVDVGHEWVIIVSADGKYSRRIRMIEQLKPALHAWLTIRAQAKTRGDRVFPATAKGEPMHKATMLRSINDQVVRAGLDRARDDKISPQVLRNTFAAILFDSGESADLVSERLGLAQVRSAVRLADAWLAWSHAAATRTF